MCGRYVSPDESSIEREFNLVRTEWQFPASYNVAPTQQVPIVRSENGEHRGLSVRWGLIPFFAKGVAGKYSTINARIETMETTASYRDPWQRGQRCLQVASGFYEWHDGAAGRVPYYIHLNDQSIFGFAGLWDRSFKADGTAIESCAHIVDVLAVANDILGRGLDLRALFNRCEIIPEKFRVAPRGPFPFTALAELFQRIGSRRLE